MSSQPDASSRRHQSASLPLFNNREVFSLLNISDKDFPAGPVAETLHPKARGPGSIPGQGTRSCVLQLRPGAAKINKKF